MSFTVLNKYYKLYNIIRRCNGEVIPICDGSAVCQEVYNTMTVVFALLGNCMFLLDN
jgi:hypothetical protein